MPRKGHKPEEIVAKPRQVDVLASQGQSVAGAVRSIGVTEVTYYRWRQEYGGLKTDRIRRLKELETENARLRRAVADLTLDKLIPKEAAPGNCWAPRGAAPASSTSDESFRCPSAASAERSASTARRSASSRGAGTTRNGSPPTSSRWPGSIAAMATARSPSCCARPRAGWSTTSGWSDRQRRCRWRREGLEVPAKRPKRGRLWRADGSCLRLRAERPDHRWSYDFVEDRTRDGRKYRRLNLIDEFTHERLAIRVARKLKAADAIDVLSDLFILRGVPGHVRPDDGPEFVAKAVQAWITAVGARTACIAPGSPWGNGFIESFNARLRDELLDGEIFYSLRGRAAQRIDQVAIESWRRHYNTVRPHASLGSRVPAPEVVVPALAIETAAPRRPASPTTPVMAPRPIMH